MGKESGRVNPAEKQRLYALKVRRLLRSAAKRQIKEQDKVDWYTRRLWIVSNPAFLAMTPRKLFRHLRKEMPDLEMKEIYDLRTSVFREPR